MPQRTPHYRRFRAYHFARLTEASNFTLWKTKESIFIVFFLDFLPELWHNYASETVNIVGMSTCRQCWLNTRGQQISNRNH